MSFTGDLEHLPIVDVIQLLHSTRKSGTLSLKSSRGESQLGFRDGYIVSANHANNSIRIGQILLEMKAVSNEDLQWALTQQKQAGAGRKPLIAMLVESGKVKKEEAFSGLETLIQMSIVEILTWNEGTFSLDVDNIVLSDDYRYFPEALQHDISLNTQNVLMDALRLYDEKMRDGTLQEAFPAADPPPGSPDLPSERPGISADDLGLGDLDKIVPAIPGVFSAIKDHGAPHPAPASPDPAAAQRKKLANAFADITSGEQEKLLAFLTQFSDQSKAAEIRLPSAGPSHAIIVFSRDDIIKHSITTVCKHEGYFVFTTDDEDNIDLIIEQSLVKELSPILIIDPFGAPTAKPLDDKILNLLQHKAEQYPQLSIIQFVSPQDYDPFLQALKAGVRSVFPRPNKEERRATFAQDMIQFLEAFMLHLKKGSPRPDQGIFSRFRDSMLEIDNLPIFGAQEVSRVILLFASALFERSMTFVVRDTELIAERGIGINTSKEAGPSAPMKFAIPLAQASVLRDVVGKGNLFYRHANDPLIKSSLFSQIGPPLSSKILLLPLRSFGKVIALTYADFGSRPVTSVPVDLIDMLARHGGLALENGYYRKKSEKPPL